MPFLFVAQYVIHEQDIVAVFIIIPVVLDSFARLSKDSSWVSRRLVFESWVTYSICRG